ncbi:hypothetical protein ACFVWR_05730 [Leifsonia sp. NPDC058292]|uniref:hypothetical protein n=1 Tax=Leifsonia sp. NPDC058292 TaxID=3346428 RepID=UPI0036DC7DEA
MKRIHYASGAVITGDDIADVLVRYAAVLAKRGIAAEVQAPIVRDDGSTGTALLLLGPASQILAEEAPGDNDLVDADFVAETEKAIAAQGTPRAGFVRSGTENTEAIDLDYL